MSEPGRVCPLRYRYGAQAIASAGQREVATLYVVGGLYGNTVALDCVEAMAQREASPASLCFNGDFNWFNIDESRFVDINRRVLAHDALQGNVEAELYGPASGAGCGCAYPESVDAGTVARSNRIHARLRETAARRPELQAALEQLPMFKRYRVGDCRVGVVHGDADALAGWGFDVAALDDEQNLPWLHSAFDAAQVDVFASTHTCLPALRKFELPGGALGVVANNGAAGMPNFHAELSGLVTRVALTPSPHESLREWRLNGAYVALLPVRFNQARWLSEFSVQWPLGSPASDSYIKRISAGPDFSTAQALATDR